MHDWKATLRESMRSSEDAAQRATDLLREKVLDTVDDPQVAQDLCDCLDNWYDSHRMGLAASNEQIKLWDATLALEAQKAAAKHITSDATSTARTEPPLQWYFAGMVSGACMVILGAVVLYLLRH